MLPPLLMPDDLGHNPQTTANFHQLVIVYKAVCTNLLQIVKSMPVSDELVEPKTICDICLNECIVICDRMLYAMSMPDYNPKQVVTMAECICYKTDLIGETLELLPTPINIQIFEPLLPFYP